MLLTTTKQKDDTWTTIYAQRVGRQYNQLRICDNDSVRTAVRNGRRAQCLHKASSPIAAGGLLVRTVALAEILAPGAVRVCTRVHSMKRLGRGRFAIIRRAS